MAAPSAMSQTEPFVSQQHCPYSSSYNGADPTYLYLYYIPICGGGYGAFGTGFDGDGGYVDNSAYNLATPWGTTRSAATVQPQSFRHKYYLPNAAADHRRHRQQQQQRPAIHPWRLQPRQQAALQHELHA